MAAQLTLTRRRYREVHPEMGLLLARADQIRREALDLIEADAGAYAELLAMYALPRGSAADRDVRKGAIGEAALAASRVPVVLGELALEVIELAEIAVTKANPHVRSDAAAGGSLARSAIRISEMNIASNMEVIADEADREDLERSCHRFRGALSRADAMVDAILERATA
jgi:formiminotetrahydrofolate cyclodeaminase